MKPADDAEHEHILYFSRPISLLILYTHTNAKKQQRFLCQWIPTPPPATSSATAIDIAVSQAMLRNIAQPQWFWREHSNRGRHHLDMCST